MKLNIVHNESCMDTMAEMKDRSIDTIITDPPYGLRFMGKKWDYEIPSVETFVEMLRVAKPGAFLLCFGGSRTFHRMAVNIEDAGWEIRDTIMWLYGSGFPKSLDLGKSIDKKNGAIHESRGHIGFGGIEDQPTAGTFRTNEERRTPGSRRAPMISADAQRWDGYGTALKPAFEPIIVAMKPIDGTFANNALTHGVAGLNIDGGRIGTGEKLNGGIRKIGDGIKYGKCEPSTEYAQSSLGRFPANLIHDGSDEVVSLFPAEAGAAAPVHRRNGDKFRNSYGAFSGDVDEAGSTFRGDSGSAARFFYCAKASRAERNAGLVGLPKKMLRWSSEEQSPGTFQSEGTDRYAQNHHPTVKPMALMRYLCRLTRPPAGGVVYDPYCGSGTTLCAAVLEGRDYIGSEKEQDFAEISEMRVAYWAQHVAQAELFE